LASASPWRIKLTPEHRAAEVKKHAHCREATKVRAAKVKAVAAKAKEAEIYWILQDNANAEALASQAVFQDIATLKEESLTDFTVWPLSAADRASLASLVAWCRPFNVIGNHLHTTKWRGVAHPCPKVHPSGR
jgi:FAD/FMN-containing dehydrogenase